MQLLLLEFSMKYSLTSARFCVLKIYAVKGIAEFCQVLTDFVLIVVSRSKYGMILHCIFM